MYTLFIYRTQCHWIVKYMYIKLYQIIVIAIFFVSLLLQLYYCSYYQYLYKNDWNNLKSHGSLTSRRRHLVSAYSPVREITSQYILF